MTALETSGGCSNTSPNSTCVEVDNNFMDAGFDPCTGEAVAFSGTDHVVLHDSVDSAGGIHTMDVTVHEQGTGTSVTGAKYVIDDFQSISINIPGPPTTFDETFHSYFAAIRQGELPPPFTFDDFRLHLMLHLTVNANGVPTVFFSRSNPLTACS